MIAKKFSKNRLVRAVFGGFFAIMVMFAGIVPVAMPVYAEPILETDGIHEVIDETTGDDTIEEDSDTYLLLAQVNNLRNIVIRDLIYNTTNGEEHLERLDSSKFNEIFEKFIKKNKDLLK